MVRTPGWRTPRIDMHWCSASISTATPRGTQRRLDGVGDLGGHGLLRLQALGEDLHHARDLGDADDAAVGQVGDVRHAQERRHVVLAVALHADVAQHDEVVVAAGLLEGAGQHLGGIEA